MQVRAQNAGTHCASKAAARWQQERLTKIYEKMSLFETWVHDQVHFYFISVLFCMFLHFV